jgi:hypothetical protein
MEGEPAVGLETPAATQLAAEMQETPLSVDDAAPAGFGVLSTDQLLPSQCVASVAVCEVPEVSEYPTAMHSVSDSHETRVNVSVAPEEWGTF